MLADPHTLSLLQQRTRSIRNICILAHVDHGKTTLSDYLLSSNGIISPKLAGKVRFLDSRPDEQDRGITMKSSSIALLFNDKRHLIEPVPAAAAGATSASAGTDASAAGAAAAAAAPTPAAAAAPSASDLYLINLIDCPGHVDFSSEVSNAVRVSDGALVLVDVLEGICVQTHAVLRTAWAEGVQPVLILNKIDRLITELRMTPLDAYRHIGKILEQVNAITSTFITAEAMEQAAKSGSAPAAAAAGAVAPAAAAASSADAATAAPPASSSSASSAAATPSDSSAYLVEIDDSKQWIFSPELGNVVFASAFDCWAFSLPQFAAIIAGKLGGGMKVSSLQKVLWGDFYFNAKDKSVSKKPPKISSSSGKVALPMFVQMIFEPLFQLYATVLDADDSAATAAIISKLGLKILPRELGASKDPRVKLQLILSRWLPIPAAVLGAVVDHLPDPVAAQGNRMAKFWPGAIEYPGGPLSVASPAAASSSSSSVARADQHAMAEAVRLCDKDYEHVLIYVSKMVDMGDMLKKMKESSANLAQARASIAASGGGGVNPSGGPVVRGTYQRGKFSGGAAAANATATGAAAPAADAAAAPAPVEPVPAPASATPVAAISAADSAVPALSEDAQNLEEDSSRFVGLARIWCGTLRADSTTDKKTTLHIFGPKYDPLDPDTHGAHRTSVTLGDAASHKLALYLLMGSDMQSMQSVPAGNVFALGGLGGSVHNTATLSSCAEAIPFASMRYQSAPIVRVALETESVADMRHLIRGLRLLNQADANVLVQLLDTGEHVVVASGELHLERCIRDLKDRFCPPSIKIRVSPPLISFRETVAEDHTVEATRKPAKKNLGATAGKKASKDERKREEEEAGADIESERKQREARKKKELAAAAAAAAAAASAGAAGGVKPSGSIDDLSAAAASLSLDPPPAHHPASSIRSGSEIDPSTSGAAAPSSSGVPKTARFKYVVEETSVTRSMTLWVQAVPLPTELTQALENSQPVIKALVAKSATAAAAAANGSSSNSSEANSDADSNSASGGKSSSPAAVASFVSLLRAQFSLPSQSHLFSAEDVHRIWAFGPRGVGPNMLINRCEEYAQLTALLPKDGASAASAAAAAPSASPSGSAAGSSSARAESSSERESLFLSYSNALLSGFQLACSSGPLCEEPLMGVAFVLERFEVDPAAQRNTGQAMSLMRNACRAAFNARAPRLMEAMYRVQLQCETDALGALYGVLSRRRGRILDEHLREGTSVFLVEAYLPVADSFGFAGDVRKKTGGEASPQLLFSHWELIPQDPFFVPRSEEELEFHGAMDATPNLARDLVDHVRRRKGLAVQEKVVQHAEKQRTIKH